MKKRVVIHIIPYDKFVAAVVSKMEEVFPDIRHFFIIIPINLEFNFEIPKQRNVYMHKSRIQLKRGQRLKYMKRMMKLLARSDRIILHSYCLDSMLAIMVLWAQRLMKKEIVWMIWGYDLKNHHRSCTSVKNRMFTYSKIVMKKKILSNAYAYAVSCDNDYIEAVERYGNEKIPKWKIIYPFNLPKNNKKNNDNSNITKIVILNSASTSCRHIETLRLLEKYSGERIWIYCILSYGAPNVEYIQRVKYYGHKIFGENFFAITEYMGYQEYQEFLQNMDIAILNTNRQQGGGNIWNLLYMGKKVFISKENGLYKEFLDFGCTLFDVEEISKEDFLVLLSDESAEKNKEKAAYRQSGQYFYECWKPLIENVDYIKH